MLLIIEALLLILAALGQDHSAAAGQIFPLDMALNSVDDQYSGCRGYMAHLVETKYLKDEIKNSLAKYWQSSANIVKYPKDQLTRNHLIAIYVYSDSSVFKDFNSDTRYGKNQYKYNTYKWYSLYFLLTEAVQILKKTQNRCYYTYRGNTVEFNKNVLNTEVRFGSFTSSSLDRNVAQGFASTSCFEIYTCEGAELTKYSKYPDEREVLIPPYEKFRVTDVRTRKYQHNLWCETVYTLKSSGKVSYQNCAVAFRIHDELV
ncbi:hypothetical protein PO909_001054 [Leuciscus waleckii]